VPEPGRRGTGQERLYPLARADRASRSRAPSANAGVSGLWAVLFDVDGTIARPGPELGPEGYRHAGERHGLVLDSARYESARESALEQIAHHPELEHDEEIWIAFTERLIRAMGGEGTAARDLAVEMTLAWEHSHNFDLYEDALPVFDELRAHGLRIALLSNTGRDLDRFAAHHGLTIDAAVSSRFHGKVKPHPSIFQAVLERLDVAAGDAAMVGDSLEDDVEGARAVSMRAFLVDRHDRHPELGDRLPDLYALPAALGLPRPGSWG
jgi:putative hydrolase of the HAD superfamily